MPGLPKKYIKKYGVSKRAWTEYRKAKSGTKRRSKRKKVKRRSPSTKRRGKPRMAKKRNTRRRRRIPMSGDLTVGVAKVVSRVLSNMSPVKLPFNLEQDGVLYVLGKVGGIPKAKTVATADAVDKVISTFIGGVNVEGFGGFTGEDWI